MAKEYISKIFVTVDVVTMRIIDCQKQILLIQRKNEPFQNQWALPGGFVDEHEDLSTAALRELQEETNVIATKIEQIQAYGTPHRDPRGHMVTIAFFTEIDANIIAKAADDAKALQWFSLNDLPPLAFDHKQIIEDALAKFGH